MNFSTFLQQAKFPDLWQKHKLMHFTSTTYPQLFFQTLVDTLVQQKIIDIELKKIHIASIGYQELIAMLSQSFLGMPMYYWLGDLSGMAAKDKEKLIAFLSTYQGENFIAFFTPELIDIPSAEKIQLSSLTEATTIDQLIAFLGDGITENKAAIIKKYLIHVDNISLDALCSFMQQAALTHTRDIHAVIKNLLMPTQPQAQLTKLTEYFFAQEQVLFFRQWSQLKDEYPAIFWISFWADLLWKAHYTIMFLEQKKFAEAKKMSYRLPSSFIQHGYKKCKQATLVNLYNFLYSIDFTLKQGSMFCSLDLFYMNYFEKNTK